MNTFAAIIGAAFVGASLGIIAESGMVGFFATFGIWSLYCSIRWEIEDRLEPRSSAVRKVLEANQGDVA